MSKYVVDKTKSNRNRIEQNIDLFSTEMEIVG